MLDRRLELDLSDSVERSLAEVIGATRKSIAAIV
jgi:hypothetical protein